MRRELTEECPVCGAALRGSRFTGYRCGKCGAFFSARYIAHARRQLFSELVAKHFSQTHPASMAPVISGRATKQAAVERVDVIIEDKAGKIERALAEAKEAARTASRHLEDVLERAEELPDPAEVQAAIRVEERITPLRKSGITSEAGITKKTFSKQTKKPSSMKKQRIVRKHNMTKPKKPLKPTTRRSQRPKRPARSRKR